MEQKSTNLKIKYFLIFDVILILFITSSFFGYKFFKRKPPSSENNYEKSKIIKDDSPLVELEKPVAGNIRVAIGKIIGVDKDGIILEYKGKEQKVYISTPAEIMIRQKSNENLAYAEKITDLSDIEKKPYIFMKGDEVTASKIESNFFFKDRIFAKNFVIIRDF